MSKIFLITRPNHEHRVCYLHAWSKDVLEFADNNTISYTDFEGDNANRENVEKYLQKRSPEMVIFNGHGVNDTILGQYDKPLIEAGVNSSLLKDKIIYSRSCFTSTGLGNHTVNRDGAKCFIGYSQPFTWVHSPERECVPAKDKISIPFKQISNEIIISLLKGHTTGEANERARKVGAKLLKDFSSSESEEVNGIIRFWIFWDIMFQELIGDSNAKF